MLKLLLCMPSRQIRLETHNANFKLLYISNIHFKLKLCKYMIIKFLTLTTTHHNKNKTLILLSIWALFVYLQVVLPASTLTLGYPSPRLQEPKLLRFENTVQTSTNYNRGVYSVCVRVVIQLSYYLESIIKSSIEHSHNTPATDRNCLFCVFLSYGNQ